jgi:hypothetical protein
MPFSLSFDRGHSAHYTVPHFVDSYAVDRNYLVTKSRNQGLKTLWKNESLEIIPSASLVLFKDRSPTEVGDNGHSAVNSFPTILSLVSLLPVSYCSSPYLYVGTNRLTTDNKHGIGIHGTNSPNCTRGVVDCDSIQAERQEISWLGTLCLQQDGSTFIVYASCTCCW